MTESATDENSLYLLLPVVYHKLVISKFAIETSVTSQYSLNSLVTDTSIFSKPFSFNIFRQVMIIEPPRFIV